MERLNFRETIWSLSYRSLHAPEIESIKPRERIKKKKQNWIALLRILPNALCKTSIAIKSE
jgi:hypothetical protein